MPRRQMLTLKAKTPGVSAPRARRPAVGGSQPNGQSSAGRSLGESTFAYKGAYSNSSAHAVSQPAPQSHAARVAKLAATTLG